MKPQKFLKALKIPSIYLLISVAYIYLSDQILLTHFKDVYHYSQIQTYKGWGFTILSSLLISYLIYQLIQSLHKNDFIVNEYQSKLEGITKEFKEIVEENKNLKLELNSNSQEIEKANNLKRHLFNNISHEFRTPLNGIIGFTQVICYEELSLEEKKEYTSAVEQSSHRLLNTMNSILELSKLETNKIEIRKDKVYINSLTNDLYDYFSMNFRKKNIDFQYSNGKGLYNYAIQSDRKLLYRIYEILLENAFKFTNCGYILFGYSVTNGIFTGYVADSGIGIDKKYQADIFDSFFQIEQGSNRKYEGIGVGLTICKNIVEQMDGSLQVESDFGHGASFFFHLPLVELEVEESELDLDE